MPQKNKQPDHCFRRRVNIRHGLHVRKFQYDYPLAIKRAKNLEIMRGNWNFSFNFNFSRKNMLR